MSYVRCACGTVYNTVDTTTGMSGCCPKCGLHHSGQYRVAKPVLKPSPLAAKPIDVPEIVRCRDCRYVYHDKRYSPKWCCTRFFDDYEDYATVKPYGFCAWGERNEKVDNTEQPFAE